MVAWRQAPTHNPPDRVAPTALITGASGFVGGHLAAVCAAAGDETIGLSRSGTSRAGTPFACDLRDGAASRAAVAEVQPDVVYHLAALASTGRSWDEPVQCLSENQQMTWNLLDAVRREAPDATVLLAGSGESYGRPIELPVTESHPLAPATPYALAKTASDLTGGLFSEAWGLNVVRARAFNHAGPGQASGFLIGSLVAQVAAGIREEQDTVTLRTGTAGIRRDYTDVRDVAIAYRALALSETAGIVNVCSGRSTSTAEVVELVKAAATGRISVVHEVDPAIVRPHETAEVVGSPTRVNDWIGWKASIPLDQTVADALKASLDRDT